VLLQEGKPVCYASKKLSKSQQGWSPIELEMLAVLYSTEKYREYIIGKETLIQTDHKPLENLFRKQLCEVPLRLHNMMLRVKGYDIRIEYLPGKLQFIADFLSRIEPKDDDKCKLGEEFIKISMVDRISVSPTKYDDFQKRTAHELSELHAMIQAGWPEGKAEVPHSIRSYWDARSELATLDGVIYRGMRIVVPPSMRPEMLARIHGSHMGTVKCKQRAREVMYWPGMSAQIEEKVSNCELCHEYAPKQQKEPLISSAVPDLPWQEVASDLFHYNNADYVLSVDYYSKYIEVSKLKNQSSEETIEALKEHFSRQGVPEKLLTDCGTQYTSGEFAKFAEEYGFTHVTNSPKHSQSNGEAEAAVKIVKGLWRKNKDKHKALLEYRTTPIPSLEVSPAQLNMSRRLRTSLPIVKGLLQPTALNLKEVRKRMELGKRTQKYHYDRQGAKELPQLKMGDHVRVKPDGYNKSWKAAVVVRKHETPRSYVVDTGERLLRRNRVGLRATSAQASVVRRTMEESDPVMEPREAPPRANVVKPVRTPKSPTKNVEATPPPRITTPEVKADSGYVTRSGRTTKPRQILDL